MASRTISFATYATDGSLNTAVTPTVTVSYNGGSASSLTPTANGSLWNVTVDDTQDATLLISGSGLATADLIVLRRDLPVAPAATANATAVRTELTTELGRIDAAISTRLASADYTAPANATIAAIDGKVDALNDLSLGDVGTALTTYGVAKDTDIPTDYSTFDPATDTVLVGDKTGFSLVADYDPAKTAASPAEVATALTTYGAAKPSDIPTDYALESTLEATQSAVEALNDFDPATDTVATVQTVVEPVTALVDVSGIPTAVWTSAERTLTDDIPTETADLLGTRHGVGLWGAADPSWPAITSATLDDDGVALGPLDSADVLIVAQADGSSYGTRSDGDGEFELRVPSGATYTLQALRPGFAYPIRMVTV